jgi:hypothetical protein
MLRKILAAKAAVPIVLVIQLAPLMVFPAASYTIKSQEWWLPVLLSFLVVLALVQVLVRRTAGTWPWHLMAFSQGFNIISRLMMLMPHATRFVDRVQQFDVAYVAISAGSMLVSAFEIWYLELPEVRLAHLSKRQRSASV